MAENDSFRVCFSDGWNFFLYEGSKDVVYDFILVVSKQ